MAIFDYATMIFPGLLYLSKVYLYKDYGIDIGEIEGTQDMEVPGTRMLCVIVTIKISLYIKKSNT